MQLSHRIAVILYFNFAFIAIGLPAAAAQSVPVAAPTAAPLHPAYPASVDSPLGQQIVTLLADPSVSRAHWGIAVTTLDGTPLYGLDEGKLFRPASNNKIFTTATAMALLGPGQTFDTHIYGNFDPISGTVTGDLKLVGGGDANLGADDLPYTPRSERPKPLLVQPQPPALSDLASLVDQLVAKGIKRVTGDIVGDDTLYPYEPYAESWAQDDQVWGYGAPVSALSINNNQLKLVVTPLKVLPTPGSGIPISETVQLEQNVPYYKVASEVRTVESGSHPVGVQVERLPGSRIIRVYGSIAANSPPEVEEVAIADPAEYAAMVLRSMLEQRGIAVTGEARAEHLTPRNESDFLSELLAVNPCDIPASATTVICMIDCPILSPDRFGELLASHTSAPLGQDVILTNKVSQNLHAELLLHNLGHHAHCREGSTIDGARQVRGYLVYAAGLDPDDFLFFDGSGLSDHDLVTPRATAQFLAFTAKQPWFPAWKASLPEGGEDGSLDRRFPDPPLKDHLFAKTGTLGESRALSGYLDAASGRQIIFSIFVDDHTPITSADRITMDKIVTAIAANN